MPEPLLIALAGFLAGFFSSIPPMGPIAILVLRRGLLRAYAAGFALAVGSALAEGIYALLALFGLGALMHAFPALAGGLRIVGLVFLGALGIYFALTSHAPDADDAPAAAARGFEPGAEAASWPREFMIGFSVALLNPTLLLTWAAGVAMVVAVIEVDLGLWEKIAFPVAVVVGIVAWFGLLLLGLRRWGRLLSPRAIDAVIRILGVGLTLTAAWLGYTMWWSGDISPGL